MTATQSFLLGVMSAWMPSLIFLAWLLLPETEMHSGSINQSD